MTRLAKTALATGLLFATAAASAEPPAADALEDARAIVADAVGIVTPDGVQERFVVTLGGAKQAVSVRGADRANPILIYIHGGPGAVEMPFAWTFERPWEDYFTVVQWDQRGAGKSYALNDPSVIAPTMTPERIRNDAIELIEILRTRYGKSKVFVLGHSWGSAVGLEVALKRPDLLHAYVGMGQVIAVREAERIGMAWTKRRAEKANDADAIKAIDALSPYPDAGPFTIDKADAWRAFGVRYGSLMMNRADLTAYFRAPRLSPDYDAADIKAWGAGSEFSTKLLWPQMGAIDFRERHVLRTPVILFLGRGDYTVASSLAGEWMKHLEAPSKKTIWFEHSAHMPMVEEPGRVLTALVEDVLPFATEGRGATPRRKGR